MMFLHSASRASSLVGRVADVLGEPPEDPMAPEWLAVPSDGMRRWLTLELARRLGAGGPERGDGVVANVVRAYPGTLRSSVLAADLADPDRDAWAIDRLVWSVLAATQRRPGVAAGLERSPTARGSVAEAPRYSAARRIADLFDRYHLHRQSMVRSWATGEDVDGAGRPLPEHTRWQPDLWRLVREQIGEPSPPERWPELLDRLARGELSLDLPPRLLLFGFTLLPGGGFLELIEALAEQRDVHLFLLEPTRYEPGPLLQLEQRQSRGARWLRASDPTANAANHPLLRSWGRLHREHAALLAKAEVEGLPSRAWIDSDPVDGTLPTNLLDALQRSIVSNTTPEALLRPGPGDRSVQFHACFGPTRQVEIVRDALLHLLNDPGSDLDEDDILVVCPAIEEFAPLIRSVFGPSAEGSASPSGDAGTGDSAERGSPTLRYRIVDQSIGSTNPVLSATLALLELVGGRFEVAEVLDFLALGPVRQRFRFDDDDLADIAEWVGGTNVRWGVDPIHREPFGVPESIRNNTWSVALDRLLVGAAMSTDDLTLAVGDVLPYEVEGARSDLVGQLAEILWRLRGLVTDARRAKPLTQWIEQLGLACHQLFATDRAGQWQFDAFDRILADILASATSGEGEPPVQLELADLKRLIEERFGALPARPDYFRGGITISSMTPLRWVPFRVVCLLGMDQSALSTSSAAGDDLIAAAPALGDPDPRAEVRQSLLETVLSAGDHLIVVRDGHDVRTNQEIPRAVIAAELFDAVVSLVAPGDRSEVIEGLEIDHPRQPFDERSFERGALVPGEAWSFDTRSLDGALARRSRNPRATPFLPSPLATPSTDVIELDQLHRFFKNPTLYFLSDRLEARLPQEGEELTSVLPVDLDPLRAWQVGDRLLQARLRGETMEEWRTAERQRGSLPPGSLEQKALDGIMSNVDAIIEAASEIGIGTRAAAPLEVAVELDDGTRIVGSVPLLLPAASPGPGRISYSRLKPERRIQAWLDLMALVASDPSDRWRAVAIGKPEDVGDPADVLDLAIAGAPGNWSTLARESLQRAVECFRKGMSEPLPFFPDLSYEVHLGKSSIAGWVARFARLKSHDPAVSLVYGDVSFAELLDRRAEPGDPGEGDGRVERFAELVYGTLESSTQVWSPAPRRLSSV